MQTSLLDLWLPILLSTVALFFASFIAWTVSPHHKPDVKGLDMDGEERMKALIASLNLRAGQYMFPYCSPEQYKDPVHKERYTAGPWGLLRLWPGQPNMGRNMATTVGFFFIASVVIAYLTSVALTPGAEFTRVLQVSGTAGILAYMFGGVLNDVWFGKPVRAMVMDAVDGAFYGIVTGLLFAALWPAAPNVI